MEQVVPHAVSRAATVWVVLPSDEPDTDAERLAGTLRERGASVHGPSGDLPDRDVDVVLAVIPDKDHDQIPDDVPGFEDRLSPWREWLIPIAVGTRAAAAFPDVSQIVLGQIGDDRAVDRILQVARVGGPALAEIFRLSASADRWDRAGRPTSQLLRGSLVETALGLVAPAAALQRATVFREFVAASAAHRRRRNRRFLAVGTAAAVVLALVAVIAFKQQRTAAAATDDYHARQGHAESLRLAGLATDFIGIDPDLPWILAQQAIAAEDTPQAEAAARQVLTVVPRHHTVALPGLPTALSSDPGSDLVAVTYTDGRVDVRSGQDGALRRELPKSSGVAELAPGGKTVAVVGTGTQLLDVATGRSVRDLPTDTFWGWAGATRMLVSSGGALAVLDVQSGDRTPTQASIGSADPRAWSVSADGTVANLLEGDDVLSVDLRTGQALPLITVPGALDIATSRDGSTATVMTSGPSPVLVTRSATGLTQEEAGGSGQHVGALGDGYVLTSAIGEVQVMAPTQRNPARLFVGHRGPAVGAGEVAGGRLATVGADRYLRLWDLGTPLLRYPDVGQGMDLLTRAAPSSIESWRPLIALDSRARRLTYTFQIPGVVGTLDATTLRPAGPQGNLGEITMLTRPLPPAGRLAWFSASGASSVWDISGPGKATKKASCPSTGSLALAAMLTGASDDGQRLALASPVELLSWDATTCSYQHTQYTGGRQQPVAVLIDAAHHASVVTTSGIWWREGARPVSLTPPGSSVVAAALGHDGTLFYVTDGNVLSSYAGGRTHRIGALPEDLSVFALRPAETGGLIGVIGRSRSVVLDGSTGRIALDLSPQGGDGSVVRDLAIANSTVWEIREDDAIVRRAVVPEAGVRAELTQRRPRALTQDEATSLANATTIGER